MVPVVEPQARRPNLTGQASHNASENVSDDYYSFKKYLQHI
jgi:hypothetical protein